MGRSSAVADVAEPGVGRTQNDMESGSDGRTAEPEPVREYAVSVADGESLTIPLLLTYPNPDGWVTATIDVRTSSVEVFVENHSLSLMVYPENGG